MPTPLPRVLEPEVMDTEEEARDYDAMDHSAVNAKFCEDLLAEGPLGQRVLDVGTGTALIPIELCQRDPRVDVVAIDLAEHMLRLGAQNVKHAGFERRIHLERIDAKRLPYHDGEFSTIVSNSIIHHIPDPRDVLVEILRVSSARGHIFIRDLCRPETAAEILETVARGGIVLDPANLVVEGAEAD